MSILQNSLFKTVVNKKYTFYFILLIGCLIVSSFFGVMTPRYMNDLYESYSKKEQFDHVFQMLAFIFIGEYVIRIIYQLVVNRYVQVIITDVRGLCFERWLLAFETIKSNQGRKDRYPLGEVLARLMNDTEAIEELVTSGAFTIFVDLFYIISCLVSFISLNTTSGIFLIIAEVLASAVLIYGSKYMAKIFMETRKATSVLSRRLSNVTAGLEQTYYTPHHDYASKKSLVDFNYFLEKQLKANVWDASYFSIAESLYPLLLAFLVMIFPYSNIIEVGILAAIIDLIQRSIGPIKSVTAKISNIQRAKTGLIRINEFNDNLGKYPMAKLEDPSHYNKVDSLEVNIKHFQYDSNNDFQIQDIKFTASKGQLVGLVGMSGCGKSTVLKILSCNINCPDSIINIQAGGKTLSLDGHRVEDILAYRKYISIVSQDSHVFTASLRFNITLSSNTDQAFDEFWSEVRESIPYLRKWNIGVDELINPKDLSSGQKQLLSALRSCYLKKPIVLFDEISSSLDADLELALRKLVLLIQQNAITIIVAHRIETIVEADQILVMDEGKLIDNGKHQVVLMRCGIYQQFINQLNSLT